MDIRLLSPLGGTCATTWLIPIVMVASFTPVSGQQTTGIGSATPQSEVSDNFVSLPADIHCSAKGLHLVETRDGWVAKEATGLSCAIEGRGPAGAKNLDFLSKTLANGRATTRDFGEISLKVNGVPPGGGVTLPNGGRIAEVEYLLTPIDPAFLAIALHDDRMSTFRAYFAVPTPFEAAITSCSARAASAWPPNFKIKRPETIWRIVDLANCSVYYSQAIDLEVHASAGVFMTFSGTITLTPNRMQSAVRAHVTSLDAWNVPVSIPGTFANLRGQISGMAMLTASPGGGVQQQQPQIHGGQGYLAVNFKDMGSKKITGVVSFIADTLSSDDATAPSLKD